MNRREFMGGATVFSLMRGGVFPRLSADTVIPLTLVDGLPCTSVMIEGKGPYPFLVATAQTFFNIGGDLARSLNLQPQPGPYKGITVTGDSRFDVFRAGDLTLGDSFRIADVLFLAQRAFDEGPYKGCLRFITEASTAMDFEAGRMTLLRDNPVPPSGAASARIVRASAAVFAKVPAIRVELDGRPLTLIVNTGLGQGIQLNPQAVERLGLWDAYEQGVDAVEDLETGQVQTRTVRAGTLNIAGFPVPDPALRMLRSPQVVNGRLLAGDGELGMDVLRRFQIGFDVDKELVWFTPNAGTQAPAASPG